MPDGRPALGLHSPLTYLLAAGVGVIGGLVGALFQLASSGLQHVIIGPGNLLQAALALDWWQRLIIPFGGAMVSALLVYGLWRRRESQGMADVMEAITLKKAQELKPSRTIIRALSSLALIVTGGSVGREGPIVYLSATLGARLTRLAGAPQTRLGLFAGCGVAAGMSSAYFAPLGASLFAMEVVLGNFSLDILAPVFVSSGISFFVARGLAAGPLEGMLKGPPVYELPTLATSHPAEYVLFLGLGLLAGCAAWLFSTSLHEGERLLRRIPVPPLIRLPLGGLIVGAIGVWLPHIWGNGYDAVNLVLKEPQTLSFVFLLFFMKILATSVTIGSGGSGGIFTPTLFTGASLGLLVGMVSHALFPGVVAEPRAYAVVGMAAVLAGTTHAPIMAIFLLFEMTRETDILVPLMLASIASSEMSRRLGLDSVYIAPLRRRGVRIPQGIEETTLTTTRVTDIMRSEAVWIQADASFDMIIGMVQKTRRDSIYVVDSHSSLVGAIRLHDIKNYLGSEALGHAVIAADLAVPVPYARPDQTIAEILERFDDPELHEMPVVEAGSRRLLAVVDRRDIISALSVEVLKSRSLRAKFVMPGGTSHYVELPRGHAIGRVAVPPHMVGGTLGSANFRQLTGLSVLTIVRQKEGKETRLLPEPQTILQPGDALIVVGPEESIRELGG